MWNEGAGLATDGFENFPAEGGGIRGPKACGSVMTQSMQEQACSESDAESAIIGLSSEGPLDVTGELRAEESMAWGWAP